MIVRTRIAPSPTGDPHVGTAYVALFNYALARRHGAVVHPPHRGHGPAAESPRERADDLRRPTGSASWDEGPDVGGPFGPYRQSERAGIYRDHALELIRRGAAYPASAPPNAWRRSGGAEGAQGRSAGYDGLRRGWTRPRQRGAPWASPRRAPGHAEDESMTVADLLRARSDSSGRRWTTRSS